MPDTKKTRKDKAADRLVSKGDEMTVVSEEDVEEEEDTENNEEK